MLVVKWLLEGGKGVKKEEINFSKNYFLYKLNIIIINDIIYLKAKFLFGVEYYVFVKRISI